MFLRTDFGSKDGIQFACQARGDTGFHGHSDKGALLIAAYGVRFLRDFFDGSYDGDRFKYHHSGEAHNIVLIDGAGQGAQCTGISDPQYYSKVADVEAIESHAGYDYVRMNLTDVYKASRVNKGTQKAMRHVVFVRTTDKTGYFVVIDDVQKDDQPHTFAHPFHYDERDVKLTSLDGGRLVLAGKDAKMIIDAVHPTSGFDGRKMKKYGDAYALLTAKEKTPRLVMVTVLYPVKAGAVEPKWQAISEGDKLGVDVGGAKIVYDQASGKVSVSGRLSKVKARQGGK